MIVESLAAAVSEALQRQQVAVPPAYIVLERPSHPEHGDFSTNVALVTAKRADAPPRDLAQALATDLADQANQAATTSPLSHLTSVTVAGPGFINFALAPGWLHDVLREVVTQGVDNYARVDDGAGRTVSIEFVSANPTGPLHAGGGRWAAYGDSLARLFRRCGWRTHTEYYINDRGTQLDLFGQSLLARLNGDEPPDDGGYHGEYVSAWAAEMPDGTTDAAAWGRDRALAEVREVLGEMNVTFDLWQSESELAESGAMEQAVQQLRDGGWVYEDGGATWLATTRFGDEKDRVLFRTGGEPTYFVPDIAFHHQKFERADRVINVLGADHHGYVRRMTAALQMLGDSPDVYEPIIGQNVALERSGVPVPMSKRTGDIVEVRELLDAVGPDATRLAYLQQGIETHQTIDVDLLTKQANDNPVFYVQYAHARIASVGREAERRGVVRPPLAEVDLAVLTEVRELELLQVLADLPGAVRTALRARAPHKVAAWLRELAGAFHGFYHDCPILRSDVPTGVRDARLWLTEAARTGLVIGLDLLGVSAPEEM